MDLVRRVRLLSRSRSGLAIALAVILAVGVALGLALFQYAGPVIERSIVAVVASLFTYLLIERDMRRRERAVDERLLIAGASMRRRTREYIAAYAQPRSEAVEVMEAYSRRSTYQDATAAYSVSRSLLGEWIRLHIQLVSYIKAAIHRVEQLRESAGIGSSLAGNASPKIGAAFVELSASLESATRESLWHMYRGIRGWDRLLVLITVVPHDGDAREEISEAISTIAVALAVAHDVLPGIAMEFLTQDIQTFQSQLPKWAKAMFAAEMAARDADDEATSAGGDAAPEEAGAPRPSPA